MVKYYTDLIYFGKYGIPNPANLAFCWPSRCLLLRAKLQAKKMAKTNY